MQHKYLVQHAERVDEFNREIRKFMDYSRKFAEEIRVLHRKLEAELNRLHVLDSGLSQLAAEQGTDDRDQVANDETVTRLADALRSLRHEEEEFDATPKSKIEDQTNKKQSTAKV